MLNRTFALVFAAIVIAGCATQNADLVNSSSAPQVREDLACGKWSKGADHKLTGPNCEWIASCKHDEFSDMTSCRIAGPGLRYQGIQVSLYKDGPTLISGAYPHHPGKLTTVRVDDNEPITASDSTKGYFGQQQNAEILRQLRNGEVLRFSGVKWPSDYIREVQPLDGFTEAYSFADTWLSEH